MIKTESRKCINIREILEYLGTDVATKPPQIYTVTGYDKTSSLLVVWTIKVLKCLNRKKLRLLNTIGVSHKVSEAAVKDVKKFIQTVCCSGKQEKVVTETEGDSINK